VPRAPLPHFVALLCGALAALAVGCGDRSNLIPQTRADDLTQQLADIKAAVDQGECDGLNDRVKTFHDDATNLSSSVDARLRKRINDGVASLQDHAAKDCATARDAQTDTTQTDTTPTDTQPDTTTTETQTTETQTETTTTPTDTTTTPTTPATPSTGTPATPSTATPPDTGGVTPGDGTTP
jgi:cell division protein FtsN